MIEFWPLTIVGIFFFFVLFSLFGFPPEFEMEWLETDCPLNNEKILVGKGKVKLLNSAPDVPTILYEMFNALKLFQEFQTTFPLVGKVVKRIK